MMAYWEIIYDYQEMDTRCEGVPFSQQQLRSRPTVPGYYWVDVWNDSQWEIVQVLSDNERSGIHDHEFQRVGMSTHCDVTAVKGKWVGPLKPTRYSW